MTPPTRPTACGDHATVPISEEEARKRIARGIGFSFFMNLSMVFLAFGFGIWTRSNAILLDGFFSLISLLQIVAVHWISKLTWRPDDAAHPYGFVAFTPLLNAIRGVLMLAVCAFAAFEAIGSIVHGGEAPKPGAGIAYGTIAAAGCLLAAYVVRNAARDAGSPLLDVDAQTWWIDGFFSLVVAVAFGIALILQEHSLMTAARYVDPVLVLLLVVLAVPWPLHTIRISFRELLLFSPQEEVRGRVESTVRTALENLESEKIACRVVPSGYDVYITCHVLMPADRVIAVETLDAARAHAISMLSGEFQNVDLDLVVTSDPTKCTLPDP